MMMLSSLFFVLWIGIAVVTLPSCLYVAYDAYRDVQIREATGLNHGRETLAKLLIVTSLLIAFVFLCWVLLGLYQVWLYRYLPLSWAAVISPGLSLLSELALAFAMIYKQRVRLRVFKQDTKDERIREKAAAALASAERVALTEATKELTVATEAQTHAIYNGPMAAQIAQTEATDELTQATTENTDVIKISTEVELKKLDGEAD